MRDKERYIYYTDLLRITALLGVILMHVSAYKMEDAAATAYQLRCMHAWNSLTSWSVPMFVMISGVFFLDPGRPVSYTRIWKHNIRRIVIAFAGWSFFYAVCTVILSPQKDDLTTFLAEFIKGHYHMWFLYMLVGLYAIVPILRRITADEKVLRLFLTVILITGFLLPGISNIVGYAEGFAGTGYTGANVVHQLLDSLGLLYRYTEFGYLLFYYAAGYYCSRIVIGRRARCGLIAVLFLCAFVSVMSAVSSDTLSVYGALMASGWIAPVSSVCLFLLFRSAETGLAKSRDADQKGMRLRRWIQRGGRDTFGAYLVHAAVIEALSSPVGLHSMTFNTAVSIPVIVIVVCVISMAVSEFMHRIPFLKPFV